MRRNPWIDRPSGAPAEGRRRGGLLLGLLAACAPAVPGAGLAAQEGGPVEPVGQLECCLLLLVPVGARSSAMGGTVTARDGSDAVFRNPAGLADLTGSTFVIHHSDLAIDQQIDAFSLLITPLSSTFGLSYQLFDKGEVATTDGTGEQTGELSFRDHLLVASFSTGLGAGLAMGVNYKLFQQRINCRGACGGEESVGTTHATDLGLRYQPRWDPALELGIAVANLGFPLQVVNAAQADPFPGRIHVGAAYNVLRPVRSDSLLGLRVAVEVRDRLREPGSPVASVGLEFDVQQAIFLRAGYAPGEGLGSGAAVGVELRYDRFDIAVSRSFVNSSLEADSEPFQVSFGLNF